ncbi:3-dehydroquinate synthase [Synechococcus sp. M16CYN]|uniref:3-dehydroquinate synthase n=1 Tax=Synechococcus sp. M16CYN TaxID=3103139 RepID=UPI00324F9AE4
MAMTVTPCRINVGLERNPYDVVIGNGVLGNVGEELLLGSVKPGSKVLVVSNSDIAELYGDLCLNSLKKQDFNVEMLTIGSGEQQKNLATVAQIHDAAFACKLERNSIMLALGGGVVGDITGFAAATWLRGIGIIQIPTTLLAMVDAAIGGKTGINHPGGKNLIGAFHQPKLVLIDPSTLNTLPLREFRAGMAEVIKYGMLGDFELFNGLESCQDPSSPQGLGQIQLESILQRSAAAKVRVVIADERESGLRAILNYGHTFGHAVETLCGYGTWLHGEAVAIGMAAVGELAVQLGSWSRCDADRQSRLIVKAGLPTVWPDLRPDDVIKTMQGDKKVRDEQLRLVMPTAIGTVNIRDNITREEILHCLERLST